MGLINRKTVRSNIATALSNSYTANLVQHIQDYQGIDALIGNNKKNPLVIVTSAGAMRNQSLQKKDGIKFQMVVHIFVLFDDGDSWTEEISEDRLDDIEVETTSIIKDLDTASVRYTLGQSEIRSLQLDEEYRHEMIPVEVIYRND